MREGHRCRPGNPARVAQIARQHVARSGRQAVGGPMTQWSIPPCVARWLLEQALPDDVRESVTGDLDEVFQRDCRRHGLPSARRRYWRQTISFTLHFVAERCRDRRRGGLMRIGLSWLDFKLGFRLLSRYPMLTVVGS